MRKRLEKIKSGVLELENLAEQADGLSSFDIAGMKKAAVDGAQQSRVVIADVVELLEKLINEVEHGKEKRSVSSL